MLFKSVEEKEQFYSVAIKSRIQLLWMQDTAMRIFLWLVVAINLTMSTMFFVAWLIVNDRTQLLPRTDLPIVIGSALLPFILCHIAAIYAAGLLIYRWRVRRAVRRRSTIVPMYEMSLDPIEIASLIGRANYRAEVWYMIHRLIQTGNVQLEERDDTTFVLVRTVDGGSLEALKWYERQLLDDIFISEERRKEQLLQSISPERLAALDGVHYGTSMPLHELYSHIGSYYLSDLNKQIRTRLIREELFHRLEDVSMWLHTFLYGLMFATPFFGFIFIYAMLATIPWHDTGLQMSPMDTALAITTYVSVFLCSIVWFLSTNIYTRFGLEKYVEAEGLYLYLDVALQERLENNGLGEREMAYFLPYAQMMGLVAVDDKEEASRLLDGEK